MFLPAICEKEYKQQRTKIFNKYQTCFPTAPTVTEDINDVYSFPVYHSKAEINSLKTTASLLSKAVSVIVNNFFQDKNIQKIITLDNHILEELQRLKDYKYKTDFIRPDFLVTTNNRFLICEINARFIFNGYYYTALHNHIFKEHYSTLEEHDKLHSLITSFKDYKLVKHRERGFDIHYWLQQEKNKLYPYAKIKTLNHDQIILELHQDEIEPHISTIVDWIIEGRTVYNDPRSLFITHDKRLLSVLYDQEIMSKYLSDTEVEELQNNIVPSYHISKDNFKFERALEDKSNFLLKKAISGKADGLVFGYQTSHNEWEQKLQNPQYVLQPNVQQRPFSIFNPETQKQNKIYLAGTLPIFKNTSFGPGCYRALTDEIKFRGFIHPVKE